MSHDLTPRNLGIFRSHNGEFPKPRTSTQYSAEDFQRLATWFYEFLVPTVISVGVLNEDEISAIAYNFDDTSNDSLVDSIIDAIPDRLKGHAAFMFIEANYKLLCFEKMAGMHSEGCECWLDRDADFLFLEASLFALAGFISAVLSLDINNQNQTSAAADTRRKFGEEKKRLIMELAKPYQGKISKDRASYEIGARVNLSPARVKKILSELFPGDDWSAQD